MKELVLEYPNGKMVLYVERFFPCTLQAGRKIFPLIRQYAKEEDIRALESYLSVLRGNDQKVAKALYAEAEKCDISRSRKRHLIAEARKLEREWKRAERNLVLLGGGKMAGRNCEGYPDPTANIAVGRVTRGEKKKRKKEAAKNVYLNRKLKNGQKI